MSSAPPSKVRLLKDQRTSFMPKSFKSPRHKHNNTGWRQYQGRLHGQHSGQRTRRRGLRRALTCTLIALALFWGLRTVLRSSEPTAQAVAAHNEQASTLVKAPSPLPAPAPATAHQAEPATAQEIEKSADQPEPAPTPQAPPAEATEASEANAPQATPTAVVAESPAADAAGTAADTAQPSPAQQPAFEISLDELNRHETIRRLLSGGQISDLRDKVLKMNISGQQIQVETTLDQDLQRFLLDKIDRKNSRYAGIVVMDVQTGRVLALAGFDKTGTAGNPCLLSLFPAASLFKIVSAASAADRLGYTADTPVKFTGAKHTLYKNQLTTKVDRYTLTIPFEVAFADSVNPVFGKIGSLNLQKTGLERAADAFGFNREFDIDIPLAASRFRVGDEPFNWAEAASGFNLDTTISPVHGAMIASAALNKGQLPVPSLVERISDEKGQTLYSRYAAQGIQAMSPRAAEVLTEIMQTTVTSGTARKAFRNAQKDRVLSKLQIGGKTGSLGNQTHDLRYDHFVGFARDAQGQIQIAFAAMVAHEDFIGTRAAEYARMALSFYFGNRKP